MTELHVDLLGGLRVRRAGGAEIRIASRKAQAVLVCLALQPGAACSRDLLSALLWEDSDPELARSSLRQALAALRRSLPEELAHALQGDAQTVALDPALVTSDVSRFRALLRDGSPNALAEVAERHVAALLEGFDARSAAFEQWLDERRRELRREQLQALERLAVQSRSIGDATQTLFALERLTALEPTNERAQRELIDLLGSLGRYTDALRQYRVCRDALRRDLDVAPEPATEALQRDVLRRRRATEPGLGDSRGVSRDASVPAHPAKPGGAVAELQALTLREAVVLSARLCGGEDDDPELARDRWKQVQQRLCEVVSRHGGQAAATAEREATAVFGLSTATGHELRHAAYAALALTEPLLGAADGRLAVGLARGQVLPASRKEPFPVTGRPVSIARSLALRAQAGQLLAARDVARELEETHELAEPGADGDSTPAAMQVVQERTATTSRRPLAGRRAELAMLVTLLERVVMARRGRTVVVRGDPGIGKSALLDALGDVAVRQGVTVHVVRVLDFGQTTRERPVPAIAACLLGTTADASDSARRAALEDAVASGTLAGSDAPLAQDLINVEPEPGGTSPLQSIDNATRERGRTRVLHRLLESAASRAPRLVIVEDVHWADAVEVAHLADLAAATANLPVLLALTTRADGDPINAAWRARARGCPVTTLDLAPLADDEARELAARFDNLADAVVAHCIETAAGNPLFLEQLLRAAQLGQSELPGSVRSLLLARIERLDSSAQRALHAAAVLGSQFAADALRHLLAEPAFDLAALERSGMVSTEGNDCRFAHALIRDAIYESLLRSVRRDWHGRAAHWYEGRDFGLQADHLAAAGDPSAATVYLRAADQERQACRLDHALTHALRARETAVHAAELCDACSALGDVSLAKGRTDDATAAYRESIDLASSSAARARAWLGLAASLRIGDRYDEALAALDHAEQGAAADPDPKLLAQLWTLRGNLHFPRGELDACLDAHERAREFAEQAGSIEGIARALGGLGDAHYQRGRMQTARRLFAECVERCEQHSLVGLRLAYLPMVAVTAAYMGDLQHAIDLAETAARAAHDIGDPRSELLCKSIRANIGLIRCEYAVAQQASARSGALAKEIGAKRFEAEAMILHGLALHGLGQLEQARALLVRGADLSREVCPTYCGPWALAALALATPDAERSKALLDEGEQLLARGCVSHNHLDYRPIAIDVSLRNGDSGAALRHAAELERYTRDEPLAPASMIVERARLLAEPRAGAPRSPAHERALRSVLEKARNMQFHSATSAIEAELARA